jgi:sugar phosphate permease
MRRSEALAFMAAASLVNYLGRTAMSIAGPELMRELRFSEAQLGEIFSAFSLGYALTMIPAGAFADRWGAARTLGSCGIASAALLAGLPFAVTLAAFLALRFLFGVLSAALYPACGSLTTAYFPARLYGSVQGAVIGAGAIGSAATPILVTAIIARSGWRVSFVWIAAATAGFFLLLLVRVRDAAQPAASGPASWRVVLHNRPVLLLALQGFFVGYYYNFSDYWSYYYFREVRRLPTEESALFTTLLQIFGVVMMPAGGWLSDLFAPRFGRRWPAGIVLAAAAIALAAGAVAADPVWVLTLLTVAFGLTVAAEGAFWWAVLEHAAETPGAAYGLANTTGNVAQFLAPLAFPWIAARAGWTASVHSAAFALAVGAVLWMLVPKPPRRDSSAAAGRGEDG